MHVGGGAVGVQGRVSDLQQLQVQVVVNCFVWVLRTELGSPARTPCTISLALVLTLFVALPNFPSPLSLFAKDQLCISQLVLSFLLLQDCCFHLVMQYTQEHLTRSGGFLKLPSGKSMPRSGIWQCSLKCALYFFVNLIMN